MRGKTALVLGGAGIIGTSIAHAVAVTGADVVAGRCGRLEEVAGAAVYLASDASAFVTGPIVAIDGATWRAA